MKGVSTVCLTVAFFLLNISLGQSQKLSPSFAASFDPQTHQTNEVAPIDHTRDPRALDILTRVAQAAGGLPALDLVHNLTEAGEITFYWANQVKAPVSIWVLDARHFRMEAQMGTGKHSWIVNDGIGVKKESDKTTAVYDGETLVNLTYPIALIRDALENPRTNLQFVGIEDRDARSVYRVRLGTDGPSRNIRPASKDILIDALDFDVLETEDSPIPNSESLIKHPANTAQKVIYSNFEVVDGIRIPSSIATEIHGQRMLQIRLDHIVVNRNLDPTIFTN